MKKILSLLITCTFLFLLVACSNSKDNTTNTYAPSSAVDSKPTEVTEKETTTIPTEKQTEISEQNIEWVEHTFKHSDDDGYQFEITVKMSPWILTTNTEVLNAAWNEVGNGNTLPVSFSDWGLKKVEENQSRDRIGAYGYAKSFLKTMTDMYYTVGQISVKNVTEGWSISSSSPRNIDFIFIPNFTDIGDSMAQNITRVFYNNKEKDQSNLILINNEMKQDTWGPVSFVIMAPENFSPKYPDGEYYEQNRNSFFTKNSDIKDKMYIGIIGKDGEYNTADNKEP